MKVVSPYEVTLVLPPQVINCNQLCESGDSSTLLVGRSCEYFKWGQRSSQHTRYVLVIY